MKKNILVACLLFATQLIYSQESLPILIVGQNIDDVGEDTPSDSTDDYGVEQNSITDSGTITGSDYSDDVLVGDIGGVDTFNSNLELNNVGDDSINGNGEDDLIFGDVLNTDVLAAVYGINLPSGSGWEVFAELENEGSISWSRVDTFEYLNNNHQVLADESGRVGGNDILYGGEGNDIIYGQEGNDIIYGGTGDDIIYGGTGDDLINAGTGINHVDGGSGENVFEFDIDDLLDPGTVTTIENFLLVNDRLRFFDIFDHDSNGLDIGDLNQYIRSIETNNDGDTEIQFKDSPNGDGDGGKIILSGYDAGVQAANDIAALVDVTVNIGSETLAIEDVSFNNLDYYPNPVLNILYINNANTITKTIFYDSNGKKLLEEIHQSDKVELKVDKLKIGVYFLEVYSNNQTKTLKIIKGE
jgi:hypothetical protein